MTTIKTAAQPARHMLTQPETAALIRLANQRVLPLSFGPSGVWINDAPEAQWAIDALQTMRDFNRGRLFENGAGI